MKNFKELNIEPALELWTENKSKFYRKSTVIIGYNVIRHYLSVEEILKIGGNTDKNIRPKLINIT